MKKNAFALPIFAGAFLLLAGCGDDVTKTTVVNEPTMGIALLGEGVGTSLKSTSGWYGGGNGTNKFGCDEAYFWSAATDDNLFAGRGVAGCPRSVG